ncbi:MAG: hypothetical protein M1824_000823 [Vezdaea acicularis]|nr:MAG: hypothetical protein M1824_000823 [Vezdaea acicularis]
MAREYADRPLTPGVVTIWYRAPELLLGTSRYTPAVDLWSAGLVLSELVICMPVLQGETELEQLALTVKLIGSPSPSDMSALVEMGCPMLSSWRREQLAHGRADNLERRFLPDTTKETVKILAGLLKWDPRARLTASEALGKGRSRFAAEAEKWWSESPRESRKELLPSFPEVRNGERSGKELAFRGDDPDQPTTAGIGKKHVGESGGYVFDFGDNSASRANKRHRPR